MKCQMCWSEQANCQSLSKILYCDNCYAGQYLRSFPRNLCLCNRMYCAHRLQEEGSWLVAFISDLIRTAQKYRCLEGALKQARYRFLVWVNSVNYNPPVQMDDYWKDRYP